MVQELVALEKAQQLAAALGVPLYRPNLLMPRYQVAEHGAWQMTQSDFCLDRGYFTGLWAVADLPVLLRRQAGGEDWQTWMSLSPLEVESQQLACRHAYGHTVVMGLGMGWVALNIALLPAVTQVTVVERDPEVIELFQRSLDRRGLPEACGRKLRIVQGDALSWQPSEPVHFLYADIWRCLEEPQTLDDLRQMQAGVQAEQIYFWGQELFLEAVAARQDPGPGPWLDQVRRGLVERLQLPLLLPETGDYGALIQAAAVQRRQRKVGSVNPEAAPALVRRAVTPEDADFLLALHASTRAEEKALMGWADQPWQAFLGQQLALQDQQYRQLHPGARFDVLERDGQPIGRLSLAASPEALHIIDLALLPEHRGRGLGGQLLLELCRQAEAQAVPATLQVQKYNPAMSLYERLGFQVVADQGTAWLMRHVPRTPSPAWTVAGPGKVTPITTFR